MGYYAVNVTGEIESCTQCTVSDHRPACHVTTAVVVIPITIVSNVLATSSTVANVLATSAAQVEKHQNLQRRS